MGRYDILRFEAACQRCGTIKQGDTQTDIAKYSDMRDIRVGDEIILADDLRGEGYFQVQVPVEGEPIRIVENPGAFCHDMWPEVTIEDGRITSIQFVALDLAQLQRTHWVTAQVVDFTRSLPRIDDAHDDYYSSDDATELRLKLAVCEPQVARNLAEVYLYLMLFHCDMDTLWPSIREQDAEVITVDCECGEADLPLQFQFRVLDPAEPDGAVIEFEGDEPSTLLQPQQIRQLADAQLQRIPTSFDALNMYSHYRALVRIRQSNVYIRELLKFIPEGEDVIPLACFPGDDPRDHRRDHLECYQRARLLTTLHALIELEQQLYVDDPLSLYPDFDPDATPADDGASFEPRVVADAPHDILEFDATCPECGATREGDILTRIAADPDRRRLRAGDAVDLTYLPDVGFMEVHAPGAREPVRIIEDRGQYCHEMWPEVLIEDGRIASIRFVALDLAQLARTHYVTERVADWLYSLPDPGVIDPVQRTSDLLARLRIQLALREPQVARNLAEVHLYLDLLLCDPDTRQHALVARGDDLISVYECESGPARIPMRLQFRVLDPLPSADDEVIDFGGGGPSALIRPDQFRRLADDHARRVPATADDLDDAQRRQARRELAQAAVYLREVLAFIPEGENVVPEACFVGDVARAYRRADPGRYDRARLQAILDTWRDLSARLTSWGD